MWDIWSDFDNAVVALGCRYCRNVIATPKYPHMLTWARVQWMSTLDKGLSPRGATAKISYPPPASRFIRPEPHCIPQRGVPKGYKKCSVCDLVKPHSEYEVSKIDGKGMSRTVDGYVTSCIPCTERVRRVHAKGLRPLDAIATTVVQVAERDEDIRRFGPARNKLDKVDSRERNHRVPKQKPGTFFCTKCRNQLPVANFTILPPEQVDQQGRRRVNSYEGVCYQLMCVACNERGRRNKARIEARKKELGL